MVGDPVKTQSKAKTQWRICEKLLLESSAICNARAKHLAYGNAGLLAVKVSRQRTKKLVYFSLTSYRNGFSSLSLKFTINKRLITYPKKRSFHFMREWVLKLWILKILIHNILSGIHFPRGWERPFGIWSTTVPIWSHGCIGVISSVSFCDKYYPKFHYHITMLNCFLQIGVQIG